MGRASKRERKSYNEGRFILLRTAEKWSKSRRASKKPARKKRGGRQMAGIRKLEGEEGEEAN